MHKHLLIAMNNFREIFNRTKTIAVVGCSDKPFRTSYQIAAYLQSVGFRIVPINPNIQGTILDETCYPDLISVPENIQLDMVDIFRKPRYTADVVLDVLARIKNTKEQPIIWTQLGVSSEEARRLSASHQLTYISNRCTLVEHQHLS